MMKISKDDYDVHDMDVDEQRKFNHINCPAGIDTKQRLYIKRIDNGFVYYCHHCSTSGLLIDRCSKFKHRRAQYRGTKGGFGGHDSKSEHGNGSPSANKRRTQEAIPRLKLPEDVDTEPSNWPRDARGWVYKYITEQEVKDYGISYSPSNRRVFIPVAGEHGLCIIQSRKIFDDDDKPKYLTQRNNDTRCILRDMAIHRDLLVITEDMLSAIKCARHADAYPLLSSSLDAVGLTTIMRAEYKKIIIWLDDDNRHVKKNQRDLKNLLELCTEAVVEIIHTRGKDPKEHTDEEIKTILGV